MSIEIYWGSGSPFAWRVLLTAKLKGVLYESKQLEFSKMELKTDSYLLLNPRGEVPTLKDGPTVLTESIAIMAYLDAKFPSPQIFGTTPTEAARIWSWISVAMYHFEPLSDKLVYPVYDNAVEQHGDEMRRSAAKLHDEWRHLEAELTGKEWIVGDVASAADIVIYTDVMFLLRILGREIVKPLELGFPPLADQYPSISAWRQRMETLSGYGRAFPPHWRT